MKCGLEGAWAGLVVTTAAYLEAYDLIFWKASAWPLTLAILTPFLLFWSLKAWLLGRSPLLRQTFMIGTIAGMPIALCLLEPWRDYSQIKCAMDHNCFREEARLVDFKRTFADVGAGITLILLAGQAIFVVVCAVGLYRAVETR